MYLLSFKEFIFLLQVLAGLIIMLERQKGFITSGVLFIFWFLLAITQIVPFYTLLKLQVIILLHKLLMDTVFIKKPD